MVDITRSRFFSKEGIVLSVRDAKVAVSRLLKFEGKLRASITGHHFVSSSVSSLNGEETSRSVSRGESEAGLQQVDQDVDLFLRVKALQTHLDQAIDLVEGRKSEIEETTLEEYCANNDIEFSEAQSSADYLEAAGFVEVPVPELGVRELSEAEALCDLDVKTRARMLTLNAGAAAIGNCIHPDGAFAKAREELMASLTTPSEITPYGQVAVVTSTVPTVSLEAVNTVFFGLQARHRELEAEDNRIKASIQQKIREDKLRKLEHHTEALAAYRENLAKKEAVLKRYDEEVTTPYLGRKAELEEAFVAWRNEELEALECLSVSVPSEYADILEEANCQ